MAFDTAAIRPHSECLENHPVYGALNSLDDLRVFMAHHVFPVWDFMSLIKYLQNEIAPARFPWAPKADPEIVRFINELVMEEESDQNVPGASGPAFLSHFQLYCRAMEEVGIDAAPARTFTETAARDGIVTALDAGFAPDPAARFMEQTFAFIATGKPHVVAAAFAFGREQVIPAMFRAFLSDMGIGRAEAPAFHYYLERHIHLDEDFHGPMSLRMVEGLVDGNAARAREAETAAVEAIKARLAFWDGVRAAIDRGPVNSN